MLDDQTVVTRFIDPSSQEVVIDLMKPINLFQHAFDNSLKLSTGHQVPNLEMAIALKFSALVSRNRPEEKLHLDASDFIQIVKRNRDRVDLDRLCRLGDAVHPEGGGELLKMVEDVIAGRRLRV